MGRIRSGTGILVLTLFAVLLVRGSAQDFPDASNGSAISADSDIPALPNKPSRKIERLRESYQQTQKDTDQLYQMAAELKKEVDAANEDTLSLSVMKKADEIQKLAGKIKNRMKNL